MNLLVFSWWALRHKLSWVAVDELSSVLFFGYVLCLACFYTYFVNTVLSRSGLASVSALAWLFIECLGMGLLFIPVWASRAVSEIGSGLSLKKDVFSWAVVAHAF